VLIAGQVLGQACSFARNVVVARLLSPEDFGIAATFGIAMSMLEMVSNLAVDRLLVQADDGDDFDFQATAHMFQVIRGTALAIFLFLLAWPFSQLFDIPHALWAFQCVALVPLLRGFMHLDPKRLQRALGFGGDVATELVPQIVLVLAVWPFTWWFKDYSAMVWLLVFQAMVSVAVSHVVARRRYAWAWKRQYFRRMYAFGWPLLLNGLLMFLIIQGDRMIIGSAYNMTQLGVYSAAFSITFIPTMMIPKVASSLLLPVLSVEQNNSRKFAEYYTLSICVLCVTGIVISTGFILFGYQLVVLTFGESYASVRGFIGLLATMQMVRVLRVGPTIASMALGDTRTPLLSNIGRISMFPLAIWLGMTGKPVSWIVAVGCLGELFALLMVVKLLHSTQGLLAALTLKPTLIAAGAVAIASVISVLGHHAYSWVLCLAGSMLIPAGAVGTMIYWLPSCRLGFNTLLKARISLAGQKERKWQIRE